MLPQLNVKNFLCRHGLGAVLLGLILARAWVDIDTSWDTWWYHVPFAGRLWGIIPEDAYRFEPVIEMYYNGFPLLGEWLQGLFWWMTGRVHATNLLCAFSMIGFCCWLTSRFHLSLSWAVVALLAIPLVQAHAASSYLDLPSNLAIAACCMLIWQWMRAGISRADWIAIGVMLVFAANIKYQGLLLASLLVGLICAYGVWLLYLRQLRLTRMFLLWLTLVLAGLLLVPVKNMVEFSNPIYPVQVSNSENRGQPYALDGKSMLNNFTLRPWIISLFEINRIYGWWSIDQFYPTHDGRGNRRGGYHGFYVAFQLGLLAVLARGNRKLWFVMAFVSLAAGFAPRPHDLRYYMFWMIFLVSINLVLLTERKISARLKHTLAFAYGVFFIVVAAMTQMKYLLPKGNDVSLVVSEIWRQVPYDFVPHRIYDSWVEFGMKNGRLCVYTSQPFGVLYTSYFQGGKYSVMSEYLLSGCPSGTAPNRE